MAEATQPKSTGLTHQFAGWSWASFFAAGAFVVAALLIPNGEILGMAALLLSPVGFFLGAVGLLGALKARRRDVSAAFAGMAVNALLVCGIFDLFVVGGTTASPRSACIANLKQMHNAKLTWALEHHKTTNDIPSDTDLFGTDSYIRRKPDCPEGGIYRIGPVGRKPVCLIPGHTL